MTDTATILAVLCGPVRPFRGEHEPSAIAKAAVSGPVRVTLAGLAGDEQADRIHHGGPDKALHHYPRGHYPWWQDAIGAHPLLAAPGAFGENISAGGLTETGVCIGDRLRLGTALVEVSQGRQPCWKLDHRFGGLPVNARMVAARNCGWYYRVIEEGLVAAGDAIALIDRPHPEWSVARVFGLLIAGDHRRDPGALGDLARVEPLAAPWKRRLADLRGA